ncbi:MAG: hypothetical protein ACJ0HO_03755 [Candidatus Thalassarchaeum sp.]|jgi:hypothetical protein|tara:strand:+ start:1885 stop:3450 length:1566 start_codon:yes stop_codon:yes gene_type:complete
MGLACSVSGLRKTAVLALILILMSAPVSGEGEKMFYPAGSSDIAVTGEPVHVGDEITASILVNNQGSYTGSVRLVLSDSSGNNLSIGHEIPISPGSSREVLAPLIPTSAGALELNWEVTSDDGGVSSELSGSFEVQVYESQTLGLRFDAVEWSLANGLECDLSASLTDGKKRDVNISVSLISQGIEEEVQRFEITLSPGLRALSLDLGHPEADYISVTLESNGWTSSNSEANLTWQTSVTPPSISPSVSIGVHEPDRPGTGDFVNLPYWLNNSGDAATLPGILKVVSTSDGMVLAQITISSISGGGSSSGVLSIGPWPDAPMVEAEVAWEMDGSTTTAPLTVFSQSENGGGWELPFDAMAAVYGAVLGFAVVLVGLIVWRAVSEKTPSTEKDSNILRDSRIARRLERTPPKKEVKCPSCEQRLSIPMEHTGSVRCPACTTQFSAASIEGDSDLQESIQESQDTPNEDTTTASEPVVRSHEEILSCPQCNQQLKVPIERRPVRSRCPACRTEFMAEVGEPDD